MRVSRSAVHALDDHPLFGGVSRRARRVYARHAEAVRLPAGSVLLVEGRVPAQVTYLRAGRAVVTRFGASLAELGPGASIGAPELAALRVADVTVTATTPIDAVVLHRRAFRGACQSLDGVREKARTSGASVARSWR
jgi:CRP-like cAMP-binding protein